MQSTQHSNEQIAAMKKPPIVSAEDWQNAWQKMLVKEKELTRSRDALAAARRRMPWLAVEKEYVFEGPKGKVSLRRTPSARALSRLLRSGRPRLA
jgi:predicted dithiol-disulfide oxidoreductase (DUF899 family)